MYGLFKSILINSPDTYTEIVHTAVPRVLSESKTVFILKKSSCASSGAEEYTPR